MRKVACTASVFIALWAFIFGLYKILSIQVSSTYICPLTMTVYGDTESFGWVLLGWFWPIWIVMVTIGLSYLICDGLRHWKNAKGYPK